MYGKIFLLLALACAVTAFDCQGCKNYFRFHEVNAGKESNECIAINLCANMADAPKAAAFHDCYNGKLGEDVFMQCQQEAFGHNIDTPENVQDVCGRPENAGSYVQCLGQKFNEQGIDMNEAVSAVNKCQGAIYGMGNSQWSMNNGQGSNGNGQGSNSHGQGSNSHGQGSNNHGQGSNSHGQGSNNHGQGSNSNGHWSNGNSQWSNGNGQGSNGNGKWSNGNGRW